MVRLDIRSFLKYNNHEEVTDSSIERALLPSSANNSVSYNYAASYLRRIRKIYFYCGMGYISLRNKYEASRETSGIIREEKSERLRRGIQIHVGLIKCYEVPRTKFFISTGVDILTHYYYRDVSSFSYHLSLPDGDYQRGENVSIDNPHDYSIGPEIELGIYYKILKGISIGLKHNSWFYSNFKAGKNNIMHERFGEDQELVAAMLTQEKIKTTTIAKSHFFSLSFAYNF